MTAANHQATPLTVRGVLFDLDGTLVDSSRDIGHATNAMLTALELPQASPNDIKTWIGNGALTLIHRALTRDFNGHADEALIAQAVPLFMDYYAEHVCVDSHLFDGVKDTLAALHAKGLKMAIVTNKPSRFTGPLLQALGIDDYFRCQVSGDTCEHKKPHPEPLFFAMQRLGLTAKDCVMVGDSAQDVRAAIAANTPALALTYGYNQGIDLAALGSYAVLSRFNDLNSLLIPA